jgi:hypothetical protein
MGFRVGLEELMGSIPGLSPDGCLYPYALGKIEVLALELRRLRRRSGERLKIRNIQLPWYKRKHMDVPVRGMIRV